MTSMRKLLEMADLLAANDLSEADLAHIAELVQTAHYQINVNGHRQFIELDDGAVLRVAKELAE